MLHGQCEHVRCTVCGGYHGPRADVGVNCGCPISCACERADHDDCADDACTCECHAAAAA